MKAHLKNLLLYQTQLCTYLIIIITVIILQITTELHITKYALFYSRTVIFIAIVIAGCM